MSSHGHRYTLVMASTVKWALQSENMPAEMRLEFLRHLDKMTDQWLTAEVIAMIEPIDKDGLKLYDEIAKLGWKQVARDGALDVLAKKFDVFAALNPSLQKAHDAAFRKCAPQAERVTS